MRKLTHNEGAALSILAEREALVPGDAIEGWSRAGLMLALDGLVRRKLATVENTDDGPRFTISEAGRSYAA